MSHGRPRAALLALMVGSMACVAGPAVAHHSYAQFSRNSHTALAGVVRTWEFTNPHSYLWVYVKDEKGKYELYGLEGPGPAELVRAGLNKDTVRPGDNVKAEMYPLRDGRNGGSLISLTTRDGRTFRMSGAQLPGQRGAPAAGTISVTPAAR